MKTARAWFSALLLACVLAPAFAAVSRVDDSGTIVSQPVIQMRWSTPVPSRAGDNTVEAELRVALRLNLAAWLNQPVRLYMLLPRDTGNAVRARWRTQGRLLAGTLTSGGRQLIYEGPVSSKILEESIDLSLETDGRTLVTPQTLQFYFEVETR
jgi:hypothetical protein